MYYDNKITHLFSGTLITVLVKIEINVHHQHFSNYYQCCYLHEIYLIRRCMLSNIDFFYFPTIHGFVLFRCLSENKGLPLKLHQVCR